MSGNEVIALNTGKAPVGPSAEDFIRWGQQPNVLMAKNTPVIGWPSELKSSSESIGTNQVESFQFPHKAIGQYAGEQMVAEVAGSR